MKLSKIIIGLLAFVVLVGGVRSEELDKPEQSFSAVSDNMNIYYIIKSSSEAKQEFTLFSVDKENVKAPLYLKSYMGNPLVTTVHEGSMVAFFADGTVISYSRTSSNTIQNYDKDYLPLDAMSAGGDLYMLGTKEDKYAIFRLSQGQWTLVSYITDGLPNGFNNGQLFFYDNKVYIAGQDINGSVFCDATSVDGLAHLDISVNSVNERSRIMDIVTANRTVLFVLSDYADGYGCYASSFINNQLNSRVKLEVSELPELADSGYGFFSIGSDVAVAVLAGDKVLLQRYELTGTLVGDVVESYDMSVIDMSENMYVQYVGLLLPGIVVLTVVLRFKKSMVGGLMPKTSHGVPCPVSLRVPAFVIDIVCLSFIMDIVMAALGFLKVIDQQQIANTVTQIQEQLKYSGVINVDLGPMLMLMVVSYVIMLAYFVLFEWLMAATPGKLVFGLKVVDAESLAPGKVGFWRILVRNLYRILELLPYTIPMVLIVMMITPRRQRAGDMAGRTSVILARPFKRNGTKFDQQA